jgi:hypothetical protein
MLTSDATTFVILWNPETDEMTWKSFGEWLNENRAAFYHGAPAANLIPLYMQPDSCKERIAELTIQMVRHRALIRTGKAAQ